MTDRQRPQLFAALVTGRGRGAVVTIALKGTLSLLDRNWRARNGRSAADQRIGQICFGHWISDLAAPPGEEVVYCRVATDGAELHCHGGAAAQSRILHDLALFGAKILTTEAYATRLLGEVAADCEMTLTKAPTTRTAQLLMAQRSMFPIALQTLSSLDPVTRRASVDSMLSWAEFGRHLTQPWKVVLTGAPNVGKSTLMNALVGFQRAIVFDQPGTTRDVVTCETAIAGWPVQLMDTAGLRETSSFLEAAGIRQAREELQLADLQLLVLDASQPPSELPEVGPRQLIVWNRLDLVPHFPVALSPQAVAVSALQRTGIAQLLDSIAARLVPACPPAELAIPCSSRQVSWLRAARLD